MRTYSVNSNRSRVYLFEWMSDLELKLGPDVCNWRSEVARVLREQLRRASVFQRALVRAFLLE